MITDCPFNIIQDRILRNECTRLPDGHEQILADDILRDLSDAGYAIEHKLPDAPRLALSDEIIARFIFDDFVAVAARHWDNKSYAEDRQRTVQTARSILGSNSFEIVRCSPDNGEAARLRAALQEITDLCKREPANPFLADKMDRVAIAALSSGQRDD